MPAFSVKELSIIRVRSGEILLVTEYSGGFCHKVPSANGPTENTSGSVPRGNCKANRRPWEPQQGLISELIEVRLPKGSVG